MSTRRGEAPDGTKTEFDHGVQYFTASTPQFKAILKEWEKAGVAIPWEGRFGCIDAAHLVTKGVVTVQALPDEDRWVGMPAMNVVCKHLVAAKGVQVYPSTRVVGFDHFREGESEEGTWKWGVETRPAGNPEAPVVTRGDYDVVVVTDKAVASERNLKLHGESRPIESANVPNITRTLQKCSQHSCFALMVVMKEPIATTFDSLQVNNHSVIEYMARNSSKPGRPSSTDQWLVQSTAAYAENFVSGNLTRKDTAAHATQLKIVADEMLFAFNELMVAQLQEQGVLPPDSEDSDSPPQTLPEPLSVSAHRWGSAYPVYAVAPEEKFLCDTKVGFYACGDYCIPPNTTPYGYVESATLSALHTASAMAEYMK